MRPDLTDVLNGLQRLLQSELAPALPDPFLQEQAAYASLLIEHVKASWPGEHLAVGIDHDDLRATLAAIAAPLAELEGGAARELATAVRDALAAPPPTVAEAPLDQVMAIDREWRGILERTLALLDDLAAGAPASPPVAAAGALRAAIDAYLARDAARAEGVLKRLGFGW